MDNILCDKESTEREMLIMEAYCHMCCNNGDAQLINAKNEVLFEEHDTCAMAMTSIETAVESHEKAIPLIEGILRSSKVLSESERKELEESLEHHRQVVEKANQLITTLTRRKDEAAREIDRGRNQMKKLAIEHERIMARISALGVDIPDTPTSEEMLAEIHDHEYDFDTDEEE